jgi:hypothetical protein
MGLPETSAHYALFVRSPLIAVSTQKSTKLKFHRVTDTTTAIHGLTFHESSCDRP